MGVYPITIVVIIAAAIALVFLFRLGIRQNAAAATAGDNPDATGSLAVLAFVMALILPVIGVILAHLTLARIRRGEAAGRPWAFAALWVGYLLIAIELGVVVWAYQNNYWQ
jgi:hypothetical protein